MAEVKQALDVLNVRLVHADCLGEALALAGGEEPPAWVHVFRTEVEAIREAAEALEILINRGQHVAA